MEVPDQYGEKIGSTEWKFSRADERNFERNTNSQVYVSGIDVERGKEYGFVMTPVASTNQPFTGSVNFTARIYESEPRFTVPAEVIKECNILPGHAVNLYVFEVKDIQDTIGVAEKTPAESDIKEVKELLKEATRLLEESNCE